MARGFTLRAARCSDHMILRDLAAAAASQVQGVPITLLLTFRLDTSESPEHSSLIAAAESHEPAFVAFAPAAGAARSPTPGTCMKDAARARACWAGSWKKQPRARMHAAGAAPAAPLRSR